MPGPDFLTDRAASGQDDVLDSGNRRRLGLWIVLIAGVVVAVTIGAALTAKRAPRHPAAASSSRVSPSVTSLIGQPSGDFAVDGHLLYFLVHESITRADISQPGFLVADGVAPIDGLDLTTPNVTYRLVLDPAENRMWMVTLGESPAVVIEFDLSTLAQRQRLSWPTALSAAAAVNGHLYVADQHGVLELAPGAHALVPVAALGGGYVDLAADPARSRLLLLGIANGRPSVAAYAPGRPPQVAPSPIGRGNLLVVGGAIWAAGYGTNGAVLARLDAATLRFGAQSALATQAVGPGLELVGSGASVLWVRAPESGDQLWCVDAASGAVEQAFTFPGPVISTPERGYRVTTSGVAPFGLAGCRG